MSVKGEFYNIHVGDMLIYDSSSDCGFNEDYNGTVIQVEEISEDYTAKVRIITVGDLGIGCGYIDAGSTLTERINWLQKVAKPFQQDFHEILDAELLMDLL